MILIHASEKLFRILVCLIAFLNVCVCERNDGSWHTPKLNKRNYIPSPEILARIGTTYEDEINATTERIYKFCGDSLEHLKDKALRVHVASEQANQTFPVLVVVRQQESVLSWKLPLVMSTAEGVNEYHYAERTLCPVSNYDSPSLLGASCYEQLVVSVATSNPSNVAFSLLVSVVEDFYISFDENRTISVTPSQPHFYGFKFPNDTRSALLRVNSDDDLCMTVSIQNISCPVYDLQRNVRFKGLWLTMQTKGGLTLWKDRFQEGFYIVFVVHGDDKRCSGVQQNSSRNRNKTVTFNIEYNISSDDYVIATMVALAIIIVFYICSVFVPVDYVIRRHENDDIHPADNVPFVNNQNIPDSRHSPRSKYETASSNCSRDVSPGAPPSSQSDDGNSSHDGANDGDLKQDNVIVRQPNVIVGQSNVIMPLVPAAESRPSSNMGGKNVATKCYSKNLQRIQRWNARNKPQYLYVSDLDKKGTLNQRKKSNLYIWNLLTVAVFYALPVVQLVVTHQKSLYKTGNQDLCYYNFLCAHPLGLFSDFNHVFSNIGYVLLGLLFIIITYQRSRHYNKAVEKQKDLEKKYGVPQHFGLFYTMGEALIMEGVLSGCYHVCPNHLNFQFDTSFMYVICILLMLKIYQTRHPDIIANSHATFRLLAAVIFIGLMGVLKGSLYFYIGFSFIHAIACITLSVQIYYTHNWMLDWGTFGRVVTAIQNVVFGVEHLENKKCMVLLVIGNLANLGIIIYGLIYSSDDFATYLLAIFLVNLILYTVYYPVMKLLHGEKILTKPLIYILLAIASWTVALYFYQNKSASWNYTPAQSRTFSHTCIVLNFYDGHDVWHFLSAAGMFFSFMVILTLDDDLVSVRRTEILIA